MLRFSKSQNPAVFGSNPVSATETLGCEPKIPRTYKYRPTFKNVGLFAFYDTFTSVFRGFRLSDSPRNGTTLGQVPMICRQSCGILAPNSPRSRSLSGNGVIRRLRSEAEWETNNEIPYFQRDYGWEESLWRSRMMSGRLGRNSLSLHKILDPLASA